MTVYVCQNKCCIDKVTTSKEAARDWLASDCYEHLGEELIADICKELDVGDLYEADLDDLMDYVAVYLESYVTECELEDKKQEPEIKKPEKIYLRRSL